MTIDWSAVQEHLDHLGLDPDECPVVFAAWARKSGELKGFGQHFTKNGSPISHDVEACLRGRPDASLGLIVNPGGTKKADIKKAVALFTEDDSGASIEQQMVSWQPAGLPEPGLSVFTGNKSVHHYWPLQESITPDEFTVLQRRLQAIMQAAHPGGDADSSLDDPCQVMRVAGAVHPQTGKQAEITRKTGERFSVQELTETFTAAEDHFNITPNTTAAPDRRNKLATAPAGNGVHYKDLTAAQRHGVVIDALKHCPDRGKQGTGSYPTALRILAGLVHEFGSDVACDLAAQADWSQNSDWEIDKAAASLEADPPAAGKRSKIWTVFTIAAEDPANPDDPWICPWQEAEKKGVEKKEATHTTAVAVDDECKPLNERIDDAIEELLDSHLANDAGRIDAAFAEIWRLGVSRDRAQERLLMLWASRHDLDISTGSAAHNNVRGRVIGKAKEGKGLRQQLPGFGLDNDLHILVSDAAGGKTTAFCELVTVMTARDKGFLDHQAPRTDHKDDPRTTALVIASDGEGSAYSMWEDYLATINGLDRGANVEIWAQDDDTGEASWNVSLHNLERLIKRMALGDVAVVVMDTANAIFRGAGVNVGTGPIETYLRLLKQIVCRTSPLWLSHHTNRNSGTTMKAIGGHPAFQEVPSVVHLIECKEQADGSKIRIWHVLKLRGSGYRRFSYELSGGELKVTDGHFFENCREQVLIQLHKQILVGGFTSPSDLIRITGRPKQSVYNAFEELRSLRLVKPRGLGYRITAAGARMIESLQIAVEHSDPQQSGDIPW